VVDTIIVVGAGAAGLAAARFATDAGFDVIVLEARDRIGGRICTEKREVVPFEMTLEPPNLNLDPDVRMGSSKWVLITSMASPIIPLRHSLERLVQHQRSKRDLTVTLTVVSRLVRRQCPSTGNKI